MIQVFTDKHVVIVGDYASFGRLGISAGGPNVELVDSLEAALEIRDTGPEDVRVIVDSVFLESQGIVVVGEQSGAIEAVLRDNQALLQSIVNNTPAATYVKDAQGRLIVVNQALADLLGIPQEQLIGKTSFDVYPREVAEAHTANDREVLETGQVFETEETVPGGETIRTFLSQKFPIRHGDGTIYGVAGISTEITARKQAEQAVAKAHEEAERRAGEMESFISNIADGLTIVDASGRTIFMNEEGRSILGLSPHEDVSDWIVKYERFTTDGKALPPERTATMRALNGEVVRDTRYRCMTTPKGVVLSISASPIRDSHGEIVGATSTFRDDTGRVELQRRRKELFDREHRIAQVLQQALVPPVVPSEVGGYRIAVKYESALREAEVGGDFYDVFELGEGKIGVLIGDVAGKGLSAAISVAAARYTIKGYAYLDSDPARVLTLANEALCKENGDESGILTAFLAVLDTANGVITYSVAGHEPPVLVEPVGRTRGLRASGIPLGVMSGFVFEDVSCEIGVGDKMLLFTDGISEAGGNRLDLFGPDRVADCLRAHCADSPAAIAEAVLNAAKVHAGGRLQDDAAIVVVERRE